MEYLYIRVSLRTSDSEIITAIRMYQRGEMITLRQVELINAYITAYGLEAIQHAEITSD